MDYYTESDYYDEVVSNEPVESDDYLIEHQNEFNDYEEVYDDSNEDIHRKRRNRNVAGEIAAEVIVDVLFHTIFFVTLFWQ